MPVCLDGQRKRLEGYARQKNLYNPGPFKMLDIQELMEIKVVPGLLR